MAEPIEKLEWKKEYEVGVDEIDTQHQKLVALAGDLYNTLMGDPEQYKQNVESLLKGFSDYTIYHFSTEENFMQEYSYPGAEIHKMAHRSFVMKLNTQTQKIANNSISDGIQFYQYIGSWLLNHIAKSDRLLADFIIRKESAAKKEGNATV